MGESNPAAAGDVGLALLVLRCQAGDERAFARLMAQFGARTLGYLHSLVGDDADDVQQEVWLTVYRRIAELANPRAFRTWLYRTTRHRALDFLRRYKRERELLGDAARRVSVDREADTASDDVAFTDDMLGALAALPPTQREVCVLRYRDDMTYAEIALVTGTSVGTVRSRLFYAKQRLHELLKPVS